MKKYLTVLTAFMLTACLGMETEIDIKQNGGGAINMTYRISNELFSMGTLPGNENYPPVPVGREDFERTFNRIPGMEMTSYSEKKDDRDRFFLIKAKFDNLDALVNFLDTQGKQASIEHKDGKTILSIKFDIDGETLGPDMVPILPIIFENYFFDFTLSLPRNCEVSYTDGNGGALPSLPYGETSTAAKSVTFHSPMADMFTGGAAAIVISW
ncbi:MAG: hypothetical protein LBB47_03970 [Spirochaetaceae bacterium]|jgi:hypothetical protein|nr:hypothetical protein [Spirochaetaceae bacterium]